MDTGFPTGSIMKYNFLVNPFTSTLSFVIMQANTYTMQELVKEVTLKNNSNNGFAILHKLSP